MTDMMINKLPSKTWNWLKVNETKLPWDMEHTTVLPEENVAVKEEPVHFPFRERENTAVRNLIFMRQRTSRSPFIWIIRRRISLPCTRV